MKHINVESTDLKEIVENPPFKFTWAIEQIKKRFKDKKLDVLTIGTDRGILIKLLQNEKHNVETVESNPNRRLQFKELNQNSLPWNSIDLIKSDKKFEVIVCINLEYSSAVPTVVITQLKKRLKKGGILMFTFPIENAIKDPKRTWLFDFYDAQSLCKLISEVYDIFFLSAHKRHDDQTHLFGCIAQRL